MDECALPSGLAELEQLHVELNSEHSTSLYCSSTHYRQQRAGRALEKGLGYEQVERSDLSVLEQLHVEFNSEHILHSHYFLVSVVCEKNPMKVCVSFLLHSYCLPWYWTGTQL